MPVKERLATLFGLRGSKPSVAHREAAAVKALISFIVSPMFILRLSEYKHYRFVMRLRNPNEILEVRFRLYSTDATRSDGK